MMRDGTSCVGCGRSVDSVQALTVDTAWAYFELAVCPDCVDQLSKRIPEVEAALAEVLRR